jgi:hypothetical protein
LALAFAAVAAHPAGFLAGSYQPRVIAAVHLVTLGWIAASILGALYLVAPIALRTNLAARWIDHAAAALFWTGVSGIVTHFWIAEYAGIAWSGAAAATAVLIAAARAAGPLSRAPIPRAIRLHLALALLNLLGAATMGILLGVNRVAPFLPDAGLPAVFAHAHLAAVGFASMLVVGVGYRLLPMVLPSSMPSGASLYLSAALLQVGVWGLFVELVRHGSLTPLFAATIVAGILAFLAHAGWMVRHPRPRPPAIRTPDPAVLHAGAAALSLVGACAVGLWLASVPASPSTLRAAPIYGVLGLLGFLGQMIVAMKGRLLALFAWYWSFANSGGLGPVPSPHEMAWRPGQYAVVGSWWLGVPALVAGLALDRAALVTAAALLLLAGTILDSAQTMLIVRHAFRLRGVETPPRR